MRFLVDECVGPTVARWLRDGGNDVVSVYDDARGTSDVSILAQACAADGRSWVDVADCGASERTCEAGACRGGGGVPVPFGDADRGVYDPAD